MTSQVCFALFVSFTSVCGFLLDSPTNSPNSSASFHLIFSTDNCSDSGEVNCSVTDFYFQICSNIQHAKLVCRKYCKLCNLIDGNWAEWSEWSNCGVTCGNGHLTRTRTCSNPTPANGGLNCIGHSTEFLACSLDPCPVPGGWTLWGSWGSCSVTCGIGLQRRDRTCFNPPPQHLGDHCFGDSFDVRICSHRYCEDAGWSNWFGWSSCSRSCGGYGVRTRTRFCYNPTPSSLGTCQGPSTQTDICGEALIPDRHEIDLDGSCCLEYSNKLLATPTAAPLPKIRLCDGGGHGVCNSKTGRVEIFYNNRWGTVCDDIWGINTLAATVLCGSIGFCSGSNIRGPDFTSSKPIYLDDVNCTGTEPSIFFCQHNSLGSNNCGHGEDVHVLCE